MATVIGANREEFILREMARRAGRKYEPDNAPKSIYEGMTPEQLKQHQEELQSFLKED
jgi:hypothetical protein